MNIDWKFKEDAEPVADTDGFWYLLVDGGYIHPERMIDDKLQLEILKEAIEVVESFEDAIIENGLLEEC